MFPAGSVPGGLQGHTTRDCCFSNGFFPKSWKAQETSKHWLLMTRKNTETESQDRSRREIPEGVGEVGGSQCQEAPPLNPPQNRQEPESSSHTELTLKKAAIKLASEARSPCKARSQQQKMYPSPASCPSTTNSGSLS